DDRSAKGVRTLTFVPEFAKTGWYEVRLAYVPHTNRATNVPVRIFHADGEETVHVNERQVPPLDGRFVSLGHYRFEKGNQWFVMLSTEGTNGHVVADAVQFLPEDAPVEKKPAVPPGPGAKGLRPAPHLKRMEAELKRLQASGPERPVAMAVAEAKGEDCSICVRGNVHNRGPKAPRGFLSAVAPAGAPALAIPPPESGRKQLAAWLTSTDNPLTARVLVNRLWHHLFGAGLVRTVDNFGSTGEAPSHPELLDFLALRFVEQGWSVKKLIREIMLSHVYQQSSDAAAAAADPENRLLGRMNRRRLDAE